MANLLTGGDKRGARALPKGAAADTPDEAKVLREQLATAQAEVARLTGELAGARAQVTSMQREAENMHAGAASAHEATRSMQGRLEGALTDAAAAHAEAAGLRAQLEGERQVRAGLEARLKQAIDAAAQRPVVVQPGAAPAGDPPAYELVVTGRDINERTRTIVIKPIKQEGA